MSKQNDIKKTDSSTDRFIQEMLEQERRGEYKEQEVQSYRVVEAYA